MFLWARQALHLEWLHSVLSPSSHWHIIDISVLKHEQLPLQQNKSVFSCSFLVHMAGSIPLVHIAIYLYCSPHRLPGILLWYACDLVLLCPFSPIQLGLFLPRIPMIFHCSTFKRRWIVDWPLVRSSLRIETDWDTVTESSIRITDTERERETRRSCLSYDWNCSSNAEKQLKSIMIANQPDWDYWSRSKGMLSSDVLFKPIILDVLVAPCFSHCQLFSVVLQVAPDSRDDRSHCVNSNHCTHQT